MTVSYTHLDVYKRQIKEIGPTWHQGKNGTPTMGGLTFYLGVLVGVVLGSTCLLYTSRCV